jgi:hypothetical protein
MSFYLENLVRGMTVLCHKLSGFSGTPRLLYKDSSGQWQGQTGVPSQETLGRMLGVTE